MVEDELERDGTPARRYRRQAEELEFDRVAFFSDAVFAIAMTLLVVGIGIPHGKSVDLDHALAEKRSEIFSFFLSFVVIGFYWLAHHRFFARLASVDKPFMQLNLLYLALIAFVPFPTAVVGSYGAESTPIVIYAATLGLASLLEATLWWHAQRAGSMRAHMRDDVFRGRDGCCAVPGGRVRPVDPRRTGQPAGCAVHLVADLRVRVGDRTLPHAPGRRTSLGAEPLEPPLAVVGL